MSNPHNNTQPTPTDAEIVASVCAAEQRLALFLSGQLTNEHMAVSGVPKRSDLLSQDNEGRWFLCLNEEMNNKDAFHRQRRNLIGLTKAVLGDPDAHRVYFKDGNYLNLCHENLTVENSAKIMEA